MVMRSESGGNEKGIGKGGRGSLSNPRIMSSAAVNPGRDDQGGRENKIRAVKGRQERCAILIERH